MPSIEYSGLKITGGKVFAIFTLLGALGGAARGGAAGEGSAVFAPRRESSADGGARGTAAVLLAKRSPCVRPHYRSRRHHHLLS